MWWWGAGPYVMVTFNSNVDLLLATDVTNKVWYVK